MDRVTKELCIVVEPLLGLTGLKETTFEWGNGYDFRVVDGAGCWRRGMIVAYRDRPLLERYDILLLSEDAVQVENKDVATSASLSELAAHFNGSSLSGGK